MWQPRQARRGRPAEYHRRVGVHHRGADFAGKSRQGARVDCRGAAGPREPARVHQAAAHDCQRTRIDGDAGGLKDLGERAALRQHDGGAVAAQPGREQRELAIGAVAAGRGVQIEDKRALAACRHRRRPAASSATAQAPRRAQLQLDLDRRGRRIREAVWVQDVGEQLEPVDQARPGAREVRRRVHSDDPLRAAGREAIGLRDRLQARELEPDLIVTQALCPVCAVGYDDVLSVAKTLDPVPEVVSLDPHTLGEVLGDVRTLAQATGAREAAVALVRSCAQRIDAVRLGVRGAARPRVAALEWFDPPYAAGHWTPQLIDYAGGEDVLGFAGEHSAERTWGEVRLAAPDVVVVMPCGFDAQLAYREAEMQRERLAAVGAGEVVAVDAAAYFSRPGPRIIDGLELLAHILHPELVPEAPAEALTVDLSTPVGL